MDKAAILLSELQEVAEFLKLGPGHMPPASPRLDNIAESA